MTNFMDINYNDSLFSFDVELKEFSFENRNMSISTWQLASWARDLRQNKAVSVTCPKHEADAVLKQLLTFSFNSNIKKTISTDSNSNYVMLEISAA